MAYTESSRIVHLNNIADTAKNLVRSGRALGRSWDLRLLPVGRGNPIQVAAKRLSDLGVWATDARRPDLLHVHYAPNAYYAWARRLPHVVHVHGTDLREDLHRPGVGLLVRKALEHADVVVAATPDLLESLQAVRKDAVHLPNPVTRELLHRPPTPLPGTGTVVFNARWEDAKGGSELLTAAQELVKAGADVWGIDWGNQAAAARSAGVRLVPRLSKHEYHDFLESADVVVGQTGFGMLTISDLETLALGRPLVSLSTFEDSPTVQPVPDLAQATLGLLADGARAESIGAESRAWVIKNRNPERSVSEWEQIYSRILR